MNSLSFETCVNANRVLYLPEELPIGALIRIVVERVNDDAAVAQYQPKTDIGRLALAARQAYLASGGKLMDTDEISREVQRRRGGVASD